MNASIRDNASNALSDFDKVNDESVREHSSTSSSDASAGSSKSNQGRMNASQSSSSSSPSNGLSDLHQVDDSVAGLLMLRTTARQCDSAKEIKKKKKNEKKRNPSRQNYDYVVEVENKPYEFDGNEPSVYESLRKDIKEGFLPPESVGEPIPTPGVLPESDENPYLYSVDEADEGLSDAVLVGLLTYNHVQILDELRKDPQVSLIIN